MSYSKKKYIVELEGRPVYASRNYKRVRQVAWRMIHMYSKQDKYLEVIVHYMGIIVGI